MGVNIWYKCITVTTLLGFSMIKKSLVIPIYSECKLLIFTTHTHTHTHKKSLWARAQRNVNNFNTWYKCITLITLLGILWLENVIVSNYNEF